MKCKALSRSGQRCKIWALRNESYCFVHSQSDKARIYRQRGDYFRFCAKNFNLVGRLRLLEQEAKKVKNDRTIPIIEQTNLLLEIYNKIDELEKRIQNEEENRINL